MKDFISSELSIPFSGEDWFDPLEEAVRFHVRGFIEGIVEDELATALGGRGRYQRAGRAKGYRNGHRDRQLIGTFGSVTVSLPRARLIATEGHEREWRSAGLQAADQTRRGSDRRGLSRRHQYPPRASGVGWPF